MSRNSLYEELSRKARSLVDQTRSPFRRDAALHCMDAIDAHYRAGQLSADQRGNLWGVLIPALQPRPSGPPRHGRGARSPAPRRLQV